MTYVYQHLFYLATIMFLISLSSAKHTIRGSVKGSGVFKTALIYLNEEEYDVQKEYGVIYIPEDQIIESKSFFRSYIVMKIMLSTYVINLWSL